jgi:hypothetical protein
MQNYRRFRPLQESVKKTSSEGSFGISEAFDELSTLNKDVVEAVEPIEDPISEEGAIQEDVEPSESKPHQSGLCDKCGKAQHEVLNSYKQYLCLDCYEEYANSDEGQLELFVELAQGIKDASNFSADEIKAAADSWSNHRLDTAIWFKPMSSRKPS